MPDCLNLDIAAAKATVIKIRNYPINRKRKGRLKKQPRLLRHGRGKGEALRFTPSQQKILVKVVYTKLLEKKRKETEIL